MPYVIVHSNVNASGVDVDQVLKQVSQAVSKSFGHPEAYVMVQLNLDTPMIFAGTVEPCAMIQTRSIGELCPTKENPQTVAALTNVVSNAFSIPSERIFMNLDDIARNDWGMNGQTLG